MRPRIARFLAVLALAVLIPATRAADFPKFEAQEIDKHAGDVVYAVTTADVNGDKKPDVVALTEDAAYWYENPSWIKHTIIKAKTERDNVCIQAHDIDGDGKIDFAIGAGWKPSDTNKASTLQWVGRDAKGEWQIHPIKYEQSTLHRIRWGKVLGNGKMQLVVAPLQGKGTKGPNWGEGIGVKVEVLSIPNDPTSSDWPLELAEGSLHTTHNLQILPWDKATPGSILIAGWEGVFTLARKGDGQWDRTKVGSGNQESTPFKGASEVKLGMAKTAWPYVATIEPWHGNQVVIYSLVPSGKALLKGLTEGDLFKGENKLQWKRTVIAEPVAWGHAVWCADLDGDGNDDLIIGQRDPNKDATKDPKGPGIFVFSPTIDPKTKELNFTRHTIDDGDMACEDALVTDLNGDGKPEIIAGGRATHNVKIYWNKGVSK